MQPPGRQWGALYLTTSLSDFRTRARTTVVAGLALISCGWPVCGLRPMRSLVAFFLARRTLTRPGMVNSPAPFLPSSRWTIFVRASNTSPTFPLVSSVSPASSARTALLVIDFLLEFLAAMAPPRRERVEQHSSRQEGG